MKFLTKTLWFVSLLALLTACQSQGSQETASPISENQTSTSSAGESSSQVSPDSSSSTQEEEASMQLTIDGQNISVDWADNPTVTALYNQLRNQPIEITIRDYASMEKVGYLPERLPSSNEQMTTEAGDITLYNGSDLAFYYNPNSYTLTHIGKIQGMTTDEIHQFLTSKNEMTVRLSLVD